MTPTNQPNLVLCELADPELPHLETYSPFCLKVHRALRVAGLAYERRHGMPASFRKLNPAGQVPVLLIDGKPVSDSTAILARLDEIVPGFLDRSPEALLWEELADTALNGFFVAARWADDDNWPLTKRAYFAGMPKLVYAVVPDRIRKRVMGSLVARDIWRAGPDACWRRYHALLDALDARAEGGLLARRQALGRGRRDLRAALGRRDGAAHAEAGGVDPSSRALVFVPRARARGDEEPRRPTSPRGVNPATTAPPRARGGASCAPPRRAGGPRSPA
jgi:glutathione S-transferase